MGRQNHLLLYFASAYLMNVYLKRPWDTDV